MAKTTIEIDLGQKLPFPFADMHGDNAVADADINIITVGWADPKHYSQKESKSSESSQNNIRFNFHINLDGFCWRESHEYHLLASLDAAITANNDEFLHVQFPDLSDTREFNRLANSFSHFPTFMTVISYSEW